MSSTSSCFAIDVSFKGQTTRLDDVTTSTTPAELHERIKLALGLTTTTGNNNNNNGDQQQNVAASIIKVLYKGKQILAHDVSNNVFPSVPKKKPKLIVMASSQRAVQEIQSKRSDPTIRGFDLEKQREEQQQQQNGSVWGSPQDKRYKFVRLEACTWQNFGHGAAASDNSGAPHSFRAMELLEKLSTDPGVVAIMKSRELVVNTLGEMDPVDDRLMQKKEAEHGDKSCLLGYNTNRGLRIDVRLRSFDLKGFLPYRQLVSTLIHELSHNWVGEHDLLFWTNFAHMRMEYLHAHAQLASEGTLVRGATTASIADLTPAEYHNDIVRTVLAELAQEMPQHGLDASVLLPSLIRHGQELGIRSGSSSGAATAGATTTSPQAAAAAAAPGGRESSSKSARELALEAAEKRLREGKQQQQQQEQQQRGATDSTEEE